MPERKLYTSPMSQSNTITDIQALKRNRERAKSDSLFLQHAAKEETLERAQSVKKLFKSIITKLINYGNINSRCY